VPMPLFAGMLAWDGPTGSHAGSLGLPRSEQAAGGCWRRCLQACGLDWAHPALGAVNLSLPRIWTGARSQLLPQAGRVISGQGG